MLIVLTQFVNFVATVFFSRDDGQESNSHTPALNFVSIFFGHVRLDGIPVHMLAAGHSRSLGAL